MARRRESDFWETQRTAPAAPAGRSVSRETHSLFLFVCVLVLLLPPCRSPPETRPRRRSACRAAAPLLAVDEMQLTDIADAAIVSRLVAAVCSSEGARLVLTSNRAPQDLYEGGLNRHVHIPAFCGVLPGGA